MKAVLVPSFLLEAKFLFVTDYSFLTVVLPDSFNTYIISTKTAPSLNVLSKRPDSFQ